MLIPRSTTDDVLEDLTEPTETTVVTEPTTEPVVIESTVVTEPTVIPETTEVVTNINLGEFKLTAYCPCEQCCGYWATTRPTDENGNLIIYTASGTVAQAGRTIAVDPSVIPHGTEVTINGHTYVAEDTGYLIVGNRIDIYFDTHEEALEFGVQYADVYLERS
jgi:3D (Asp-Asp-Asp) domain-containing protein